MKLRQRAESVKYASDSDETEVSQEASASENILVMNQRRRKVQVWRSQTSLNSENPISGALLRYAKPNVNNTLAACCLSPKKSIHPVVEDSDEDFVDSGVSQRKGMALEAKRNRSRFVRKSYREISSSSDSDSEDGGPKTPHSCSAQGSQDPPDSETFSFREEVKGAEVQKTLVPGRRRLLKVAYLPEKSKRNSTVPSSDELPQHSEIAEETTADCLSTRKSKRVVLKKDYAPNLRQGLSDEDETFRAPSASFLRDVRDAQRTASRLEVDAYGLRCCEGISSSGLVKRLGHVDRILGVRNRNRDSAMYSVKERGKSYRNVVMAKEALLRSNCPQLLRNFIRKMDELQRVDGSLGDREDSPAFDPLYLRVDRIVAQEERRAGRRYYLVKWCALPYTEATWELQEDLTSEDDQAAVDRFLLIQSSSKAIPASSGELLFRDGRVLRDYQEKGLAWMDHNFQSRVNCILADEMGLGKTMQAVSVLQNLRMKRKINGPFLVIAPVSTLGHWQREVESLTDMNCVVFSGSAEDRGIIKEYEFFHSRTHQIKFSVLLTSFEMLMKDQAFLSKQEWRYIVVDEAHRLKSKDSKTTRFLKQLNVRKGGLLLLTGTPVQNNTKEIFFWANLSLCSSLLNLLDPQKFCLEEDFLLKYGDLKNAEQVRDLQENILKPRLLRRLKEDVEKSIPLKEETIIWVELTKEQRSYYRAILESRISDLLKGSQTSNIPNLRNVAMELRKLCNHPFLCNGLREDLNLKLKLNNGNFLNEVKDSSKALCLSSGKIMLLEKLLPMLKNAGHRVLLFSQFAIMLDLLEEYLVSKDYTYERIDGSVRGSDRQAAIDRYSAKDSDTFLFLLSTRAGGLGITLTAADTCIIYDSDWNPQNDLQAMARCHRIGQKKDVRIYRLITRNTYEQHLFECSSRKYGLDEAILGSMQGINPDNEHNKNIENLLKRGAYSMLKEDREAEAAAFHAQNIEQILESRTEKRPIGRRGNNTFSVATFISNPEVDSVFDEKPDSDGCPLQFWQDLLPEACFTALDVDKKIQTSCGPRKRLKINYRERYGASDLESSDEECQNPKRRYPSTRRKGIQDRRTTDGVKQWSKKELKKLESCLIQLGANRTEQIMVEAGLEHRGIEEVQQLCDVLTQLCHYFQVKNAMVHNDSHPELPDANAEDQSKIPKYENDPLSQYGGWNSCTLKNFSSSPNGVNTSNGMDTKQGEDLITSKNGSETSVLGASSANMQPKKGILEMPMVPPYAQKALRSQTFMNRLQKKATRYLQTIHERETLAKALCDGKILPPCVQRTKKLPNWWGAAEDADLLMGALRHGHRNFRKIREDKSLCFSSRFDLVKTNILNEGGPHPENCVPVSAVTDGIENPTETRQDEGDAWPQDFVLASRLKKLIQALQTHTDRNNRLKKEAKKAVLTRVINRSQASGTHPQEGLVILQRCLSGAEEATHSKQSRVELSKFDSSTLSSSRELMTSSEKQTFSTMGPVPLLAAGSKYDQCTGCMEVSNTSSEGSEDENFHFKESATQHLFRRQRMAPAGNHSITTTVTENVTFLLDSQAKNTVKACLPSIQTSRRHPIWAPGKENGPVPSSRPPKQAGLSMQQKTGERRWPLVSSKLQPLSTASNSSSVNLQPSIPVQKHKDVPKRKAYFDGPVSSKKLKDFGKQQTLLGFLAPKSAGAK